MMDIHDTCDFASFFIICTGTSERLLDALAKNVMDKARDIHKRHGKVEGVPSAGWLVVDFGDIVVHIFSRDQREYYQLEQLWDKGKILLRLQ